jgi:hypothetical protein
MNTIKMPGFTAEVSIYQSTATYFTSSFGSSADGVAVVQPQFRSRVRRQCGPCVNGKRDCFLYGYECTVIEGAPGSPDLGIPPGPGHVRCEPEIFREWEQAC